MKLIQGCFSLGKVIFPDLTDDIDDVPDLPAGLEVPITDDLEVPEIPRGLPSERMAGVDHIHPGTNRLVWVGRWLRRNGSRLLVSRGLPSSQKKL